MATKSAILIPKEDYKKLRSILKGRNPEAIRNSRKRTARLCKSIAAHRSSIRASVRSLKSARGSR